MSESNPYDYKQLSDEDAATIRKLHCVETLRNKSFAVMKLGQKLFETLNFDLAAFDGNVFEFMHVGPKGYFLMTSFLKHADEVKNMPLRDSDVFVVTFPRSGTTWTQELVWLIANNLDFEKAKSIPLTDRFPYLEFYMFMQPTLENVLKKKEGSNKIAGTDKLVADNMKTAASILAETPSPRFIKTHLPLSLLPTETIETAKVVYVARDPKDVAVSLYHFIKSLKTFGLNCEFKDFYYEAFVKGLTIRAPFFEHIKEAWALRNHRNLLFLRYEELSKDLKAAAKRVSSFLGKQYTDEQLGQLCDHLTFDNFQQNKAVDLQVLKQLGIMEDKKTSFVRKGKVGGWREYFDPEMEQHAAKWIEENLRGTGLSFQD